MQQYFQNKIPYEQYAEKNNEAVSITKPELKQNRYTDIVFAGYRWDAQAVLTTLGLIIVFSPNLDSKRANLRTSIWGIRYLYPVILKGHILTVVILQVRCLLTVILMKRRL